MLSARVSFEAFHAVRGGVGKRGSWVVHGAWTTSAHQLGFGHYGSDFFCNHAGGDDDVVILGQPTLRLLGIDVYDSLGARAREHAALTGVDTAAYQRCRRIVVSVDALQQQPRGTPAETDETVERLVARVPDIDMSPENELQDRSEALEVAVLASAAAGSDKLHEERLRDVNKRHWNAFRRGLRRATRPRVSSPCAPPLSRALGRSRRGRASTTPSRPLGSQHA